jgi:hypothetical protein
MPRKNILHPNNINFSSTARLNEPRTYYTLTYSNENYCTYLAAKQEVSLHRHSSLFTNRLGRIRIHTGNPLHSHFDTAVVVVASLPVAMDEKIMRYSDPHEGSSALTLRDGSGGLCVTACRYG